MLDNGIVIMYMCRYLHTTGQNLLNTGSLRYSTYCCLLLACLSQLLSCLSPHLSQNACQLKLAMSCPHFFAPWDRNTVREDWHRKYIKTNTHTQRKNMGKLAGQEGVSERLTQTDRMTETDGQRHRERDRKRKGKTEKEGPYKTNQLKPKDMWWQPYHIHKKYFVFLCEDAASWEAIQSIMYNA